MNIPKMTDDEMTLLLADKIGFGDSDLQTVNRGDLVSIIRAVEAARDAQVQAALAEQEPVARMHVGGLPQFGSAAVITKLPAADALPHGDYTLYAAAQERAEPVAPAVQTEKEITDLIQQREHRDEIIDQLCDAVLGLDRAEWSSAYYFEDAVNEVNERMAWIEQRLENRDSNAILSATPPAPAQPANILTEALNKAQQWSAHMADKRAATDAHDAESAQPSPEPSKPAQAEAPNQWKIRWEQLAYMVKRGIRPDVIVHYIERPDRLDYSAELRAEHEKAGFATLPPASAAGEREITDAMVDAYLQANDAYWHETDVLPLRPDKWRNGTPREATRVSLRAALATKPQAEQDATLPAQTVQDEEPRCTCPTSGPDYCPRHAP